MDSPRQAICQIKHRHLVYGDRVVLSDIDLSIYRGEKIAILGKSGAGKSTLLSYIFKQLQTSKEQHKLTIIPQQSNLVANLSTFHNVYMGQLDQHSSLYNCLNLLWPLQPHKRNILQLLETLQLPNSLFKNVSELSGGQQQRVSVARALYANAHTLIADEPAAHLDKPLAEKVIQLLAEKSETTIISLHDTHQALQFADRIIGIHSGKIILDSETSTIDSKQLTALYEHG